MEREREWEKESEKEKEKEKVKEKERGDERMPSSHFLFLQFGERPLCSAKKSTTCGV